MAIAGGACTAYRCHIQDNMLYSKRTTSLKTLCADPAEALPQFGCGEAVIVAGSDMAELRRLLVAQGVEAWTI